MLDYAFLDIFETFSRDEIKLFRRFILSPYFNRSRKVIKLFDQIVKYHPNYDNPNLTKENLLKKISPDLPYNEITMRRLLYDLQILTEKFTKQVNFEKKAVESTTFMTEEIGVRGAGKMFYKNVKAAHNRLDGLGYVNSDTCLSKFKLETDQFYFGMINNKINKKTFVESEAKRLIGGITYLISYFMLEAIKHNDTLLTYSRSFNVKHNEKVISEFINLFDFERLEIFMKKNSILGNYIVEVYLNALKTFLYFDSEFYYKEFKKTLYKYMYQLSLSDNNFLFMKLEGYCILKAKNNPVTAHHYDNELFRIYKTFLKEKYYETETNKYIAVDLFRNILIRVIKLKELNWLEDFIQNYGIHLHPNRKTDIVNFSYALLYFERNAIDESLGYLSRIKLDEFVYNLDVKNLYIRIYYERGNYDTASASARALRKFINENSLVSENMKAGQENFTKFIIKLLNYHNTNSKTDLTSLSQQINKTNDFPGRDWLVDKLHSPDKSIRKAI
jgi:hypothetical protein